MYIKNKGKSYNRRTLVELFLHEKPATYDDAECTRENCRAGAYRSVTDILTIVRTYYPVTSLEAILRIIKTISTKDKRIKLIWCTQINKVVLRYNSDDTSEEVMSRYSVNRYLNTKGGDGYSLNDYQQIINKL